MNPLKRPFIRCLVWPDLFNWPVVFFIESGVWLWPAVRIGFQQKVQGLNVTLRTLSTRPRVFQVADFMTAEAWR